MNFESREDYEAAVSLLREMRKTGTALGVVRQEAQSLLERGVSISEFRLMMGNPWELPVKGITETSE